MHAFIADEESSCDNAAPRIVCLFLPERESRVRADGEDCVRSRTERMQAARQNRFRVPPR